MYELCKLVGDQKMKQGYVILDRKAFLENTINDSP